MADPDESAEQVTPPRYYLVAPTGLPNYGDELIAAMWLRHLAEVAPDADVWVDTHSPGPAAVLLDGLHPRVRFTDTLWRLCWEAPSEEPWEVASWVQAAVHNPGMAPRWHHGIELLATADVVHLVGGGYANAVWPRHIGLLAGAVAAVKRSGGRAAMTGQGLLPVRDETTALLCALADRFDLVDVRDDPSAELLSVSTGVDDAFLAVRPELYAPADDAPEVMLCLQSDLVEGGAAKLAAMALSTLRSWKVAPERIGVVEGVPRVDRDVYALFEQEIPGARFYPFAEIWDGGLPVSPGQTWLSTRFHLHLAAAAGGAPGVAISVRPDYYAVKHRSLAALGSGWTVHEDLATVPDRPTGSGFDRSAVEDYAAAKRAIANRIYPEPPPAPRRLFPRLGRS
ncbi:polysaccharide pyruvyl transferase family protein [Amycolatopsis sp. CA-230715]|uniref:polysaccharide pyruvyl transferase family protein n=1 Tax=Amycolatopsis sp. CA-230715 TaxID=2745196 RepID=UPI001C02674C|nr:polysaccharide pyruvyl transferase family protein [Amycolatopsis sp. CA-230715]QWF80176.1 hypothetical protein HUW46_03595 [Amycolatopsis sp. CA-230715]